MASLQALTREIDGIVSVPYPASLSALSKILTEVQLDVLQAWVAIKPCQIDPLIRNLISRVGIDNQVPFILRELVPQQDFCQSLCRHDPNLLEALFVSAVSDLSSSTDNESSDITAEKFHRYTALASISLPEDLSTLVSHHELLDLIVMPRSEESSRQWLQRLRKILTAVSFHTIMHLKDATLLKCIEKWRCLLRGSDNFDAMSSVYVASLLYRQAGSRVWVGSAASTPTPIPQPMRSWVDKCSALFQGEKASCVISTAVLRVIKHCSETSPLSSITDIQAVQTAQEVLASMDTSKIEQWVHDNDPCAIKLAQKIQRTEIVPELRDAAIGVLSIINPGSQILQCNVIVDALAQILKVDNDHWLRNMQDNFGHTEGRKLLYLWQQLSTLTSGDCTLALRSLLHYVFEQCQPSPPLIWTTVIRQRWASVLLESLRNSLSARALNLSKCFVKLLNSTELLDWWPMNLLLSSNLENCASLKACPYELEKNRLQLAADFSFLVLYAASISGESIKGAVFKMMEQQIKNSLSAKESIPCHYGGSQYIRFAEATLGNHNSSSTGWQEHLSRDFTSVTNQVQETVWRYIHSICKDLQDRCENVEVPLREQREKVRLLEDELALSCRKTAELEVDNDNFRKSCNHERDIRHKESMLREAFQQEVGQWQHKFENLQKETIGIKADMQLQHQTEIRAAQGKAEADANNLRLSHEQTCENLQDQLMEAASSVLSLQTEVHLLSERALHDRTELNNNHQEVIDQMMEERCREVSLEQNKFREMEQQSTRLQTQIEGLLLEQSASREEIREFTRLRVEERDRYEAVGNVIRSKDAELERLSQVQQVVQRQLQDLTRAQASDKVQMGYDTKRIRDLEKALFASQGQARAHEKALQKARKAESSVLAILRGNHRSSASPDITTTTSSKRLDSTLTPPRLPVGSFISEEEEDYVKVKDSERHQLDSCSTGSE